MSQALAQEIVNNTSLSPGQEMGAVQINEVAAAFRNGRISANAIQYATDLFRDGGSLPALNGGGGPSPPPDDGGGGGPSPPQDESTVSVTLDRLRTGDTDPVYAGGAQSILVDATVTNEITSGGGEQITATVEVTIDGTRAATAEVPTSPGESATTTIGIENVEPGTREVCVRT